MFNIVNRCGILLILISEEIGNGVFDRVRPVLSHFLYRVSHVDPLVTATVLARLQSRLLRRVVCPYSKRPTSIHIRFCKNEPNLTEIFLTRRLCFPNALPRLCHPLI